MHPIGQNVLLIYPHFGIVFFQSPQFLNSEDSETVKLGYFLSIWSTYIASNRKNIFHRYLVGIYNERLPAESHFYLSRFKIYRKTSHSDDLVRVVRNSCITCFHPTTLRLRISIFYSVSTVEKAYGKTCPIPLVKSTVLLHISIGFLLYFAAILFSHPKNHNGIIFQIYGFQC